MAGKELGKTESKSSTKRYANILRQVTKNSNQRTDARQKLDEFAKKAMWSNQK